MLAARDHQRHRFPRLRRRQLPQRHRYSGRRRPPRGLAGARNHSALRSPALNDRSKGHVPEGPLDPVAAQIAGFFAADPGWNALKTNSIAETRAAIRAATPVTGEPAMQRVEEFQVPVAGGAIALRYYQPGPQPHAIIVWAHGGGFALGSLDEIDNFARFLAEQTGCAVASVEYRLAPEHRFPTAVEDMLAAIRWVADRRPELAGTNVPLVVGGDSAGATLVTVATRKLHEAGACSI